jgi:GntR family transcriptional repressor for pyruvate dehydrogenase complex
MTDSLPDGVAALRPLVPETAAGRIADRFVTAIALGQFVVGQKLPSVQELSAMLEVSPATVRQALSRLAALGYVTVSRGRHGGTVVAAQWGPASDDMVRRALEPAWEELQVTLDFRSLVEQQIARTAALRHTPADAERIRRAVRAYEEADSDRESSRIADLEVHTAVAAATHNSRLLDLSLRLRHEVTLGLEAEPFDPEVREIAITHHAELADAVLRSDAENAAALAARHFSLTEYRLRQLHARIHGHPGSLPTAPVSVPPAPVSLPPAPTA